MRASCQGCLCKFVVDFNYGICLIRPTRIIMKFTVLDDLPLLTRSLMLTLCGLTCCWGFVNNTILLVLAGKIGFPLAVASCALSNNRQQIVSMLWYTFLLIALGTVYFYLNSVSISLDLTKNYIPNWHDLLLAIGLGAALSIFWNHAIRINVIVMSAGLASLLPACIMAGYWISQSNWTGMWDSIALYLQYVLGMCAGAYAVNKIIKED
jgi:hypothetical protein